MYMYNYHFFSGMVSHFNILSGQYSYSTCRMLTAFYIYIFYFIYLSLLERMSLQRWCHVNSVSLYAEAMHYSVKKNKNINKYTCTLHTCTCTQNDASLYMHTCNFIHAHKWWAYVYMYMRVCLPNIVKMRNTHE